jgi:hypothetical protein
MGGRGLGIYPVNIIAVRWKIEVSPSVLQGTRNEERAVRRRIQAVVGIFVVTVATALARESADEVLT